MKKYYLDTNIFLRYFLDDNKRHAEKASNYFLRAQKEEIILVVLPQIIFEINYILSKVYKVERNEIGNILRDITSWSHLNVKNRSLLYESILLYKDTKIDLVDIYLFLNAKKEKSEVLSFDKDFKKLKKRQHGKS